MKLTDLLRRLRVAGRQALGREPVVRRRIVVPLEFHGSEYGGWMIMAGSLNSDSVVVDAGVGEDASFALSLISRYGCAVHAFDPTPRAVRYARSLDNPRLVLHEAGVGAETHRRTFYLPTNPAHVSGSVLREPHLHGESIDVELVSVEEMRRRIGSAHIDLLKMDIEGSEYDVIESSAFAAAAPSITQLCVEFHHRWQSRGKRSTEHCVDALRQLGFDCAWRAPTTNEEFLFVQRSAVGAAVRSVTRAGT